jgi:hypothetical protein
MELCCRRGDVGKAIRKDVVNGMARADFYSPNQRYRILHCPPFPELTLFVNPSRKKVKLDKNPPREGDDGWLGLRGDDEERGSFSS